MKSHDTLVLFVPRGDVDTVLAALFAAGAGRIGDYDMCAFTADGTGQFRPLPGTAPAVGEVGAVERVAETRCEVPFDPALHDDVMAALVSAHPYDEPAYYVVPGSGAGPQT